MTRSFISKGHGRTWKRASEYIIFLSIMILLFFLVLVCLSTGYSILVYVVMGIVSVGVLALCGLGCAIRSWDEENNKIDQSKTYQF